MFFSGIADEAGPDIVTQIKAHRALGWKHIELRLVDGKNICEMSDGKFDQVAGMITEFGRQVSCFGSAIGNWARPITTSFLDDVNVLRRTIKRMHRLNVPFIRIMSYPNNPKNPLPEAEWHKRAIKRMKGLVKIAEGEDIVLAHENCSGWGGITAANNVALLEEIDSPAFGVLFDTGNPPSYDQDAWEWYQAVKSRIVYVHIKDAKRPAKSGEKEVYTLPGEGDGDVRKILTDLLNGPYFHTGGISIEPHMAAVIHTGQTADPEKLYQSYIEYATCLERLVEELIRHC